MPEYEPPQTVLQSLPLVNQEIYWNSCTYVLKTMESRILKE
jgi:hypothetical protein